MIYQQQYVNLLSEIIKQLKIPQTINQLVPYDNQWITTPDAHLILLDILSAMVHLSRWAEEIDLASRLS